MDLYTVRTALKTTIDAHLAPTVRGYSFLTKKPQAPCYMIAPKTITYQSTLDGDSSPLMVVHLLAGVVDTEGAQKQMDAWLGSTGTASVVAALFEATFVDTVTMEQYGSVLLRDGVTELLSSQLVVRVLGDSFTDAVAP